MRKIFRKFPAVLLIVPILLLWQLLPTMAGCKNSSQTSGNIAGASVSMPGTAPEALPSGESNSAADQTARPLSKAKAQVTPNESKLEPKGRPVFDLLDNRTLGHLVRDGGLAVFAGDPGFVRYAHGNMGKDWFLMDQEDNLHVAFLNGKRASLSVPISTSIAQSSALYELLIRHKSRKAQTMEVSLNGKLLERLQLDDGWQTIRIPLKKDALTEGENTISFAFSKTYQWGKHSKSAGPFHWIWIRPKDTATEAEIAPPQSHADNQLDSPGQTEEQAQPHVEHGKLNPEPVPLMAGKVNKQLQAKQLKPQPKPLSSDTPNSTPAEEATPGAGKSRNKLLLAGINLPPNGGIAWHVAIPPMAHLDLAITAEFAEEVAPPAHNAPKPGAESKPSDACVIKLHLQGEGTPEVKSGRIPAYGISAQALQPIESSYYFSVTPGTSKPQVFRTELDQLAGRIARIEIIASTDCHNSKLAGGAMYLNDSKTTVTTNATTTTPTPAPAPPENVIFYLIDTLRADRIKAINPDTRIKTVGYERMAAEGATFTQVYSQGNESFVSHAAIFTGQYPRRSAITRTGIPIPSTIPFMAEAIRKDSSIKTAGYTSNGYIARRNGYERGWDTYVNTLGSNMAYLSPALYQYATTWLTRNDDNPFFLYLGPVDPHVTYRAHKDILPMYDPDPYTGLFVKSVSGHDLGKIKSGAIKVTDRDKIRVTAIYDDEVTFAGNWLDKMLQWLDERGTLDKTMIIVTSDHGDEFWEHGTVGHGHSVHEGLVHVPLMIRYPAYFQPGSVFHDGADTTDIFPTIMDALGKPIPISLQGESLLPHQEEGIRVRKAGYPRPSVATHYTQYYAMRLGRWKLIARPQGKNTIYDLGSDPTEQKDVFAQFPIAARYLIDPMALFLAYEQEWNKREWGVPSNLESGFNLR